MATRWTSKHTGQKIDDTIDYVCNPNLLDNWYFGNPVNQRGQTEYTASGYTVDRWTLGADGKVKSASVVSSGIALSNGDDTTYCNFAQIVEKLPAGTYIVSFLVDDFSNVNQVFCEATNASSFTFNSNVVSLKFTLDADSDSVRVGIQKKLSGNVLTIKAAKLELGSQQTLAHQDADGNWVLNEIPDYGEQLLRCQRYMLRIGYTYDSTYAPTIAHGIATATTVVRFFIPTPVAMRISPALKYYTSISSLKAIGAGQSLSISSFTAVRAESNGILLIAAVTGATTNEAYSLYLTDASGLLIDANL